VSAFFAEGLNTHPEDQVAVGGGSDSSGMVDGIIKVGDARSLLRTLPPLSSLSLLMVKSSLLLRTPPLLTSLSLWVVESSSLLRTPPPTMTVVVELLLEEEKLLLKKEEEKEVMQ